MVIETKSFSIVINKSLNFFFLIPISSQPNVINLWTIKLSFKYRFIQLSFRQVNKYAYPESGSKWENHPKSDKNIILLSSIHKSQLLINKKFIKSPYLWFFPFFWTIPQLNLLNKLINLKEALMTWMSNIRADLGAKSK